MNKKTITIRKMIDALKYGKNVRQTTGRFIRFAPRKPFGLDEPFIIGSACAVGKIALTLGFDPETLPDDKYLGHEVADYIITLNDSQGCGFTEIADGLEKDYADKLDMPIEVEPKTYAYPVLEIDRG